MYSKIKHCDRCQKDKHHMMQPRREKFCLTCMKEVAKERRQEFLDKRAAMPTEERLALIEEWMYDHNKKPHRPMRIG